MLVPAQLVKKVNDDWVSLDYEGLKAYENLVRDRHNNAVTAVNILKRYFKNSSDEYIPVKVIKDILEEHLQYKLKRKEVWSYLRVMGCKDKVRKRVGCIYETPVGIYQLPEQVTCVVGLSWKKELMPQKNDEKNNIEIPF